MLPQKTLITNFVAQRHSLKSPFPMYISPKFKLSPIVHVIKINQDQKASQAQHISFHISTCIRPSDATDITWLPPRLVRGRWALATSTAPWASTAMALAPALNSCAEVWTKAMAASASSWSSWMNSVKALNFSGTMWYNGTIKMEDSIFEANKIPEWYVYIYIQYIYLFWNVYCREEFVAMAHPISSSHQSVRFVFPPPR